VSANDSWKCIKYRAVIWQWVFRENAVRQTNQVNSPVTVTPTVESWHNKGGHALTAVSAARVLADRHARRRHCIPRTLSSAPPWIRRDVVGEEKQQFASYVPDSHVINIYNIFVLFFLWDSHQFHASWSTILSAFAEWIHTHRPTTSLLSCQLNV